MENKVTILGTKSVTFIFLVNYLQSIKFCEKKKQKSVFDKMYTKINNWQVHGKMIHTKINNIIYVPP